MVGLREPFYSAMNTFQDGKFFLNEFITEIKLICIKRDEEILVNDKQLRHLVHNQLSRLLNKDALFLHSEKWTRNAIYGKAYDFDKKVTLIPGNNISRAKLTELMEPSNDKIVKALLNEAAPRQKRISTNNHTL